MLFKIATLSPQTPDELHT